MQRDGVGNRISVSRLEELAQDRGITSELYEGGSELRLQQEMALYKLKDFKKGEAVRVKWKAVP
jgi:hypothetical protein